MIKSSSVITAKKETQVTAMMDIAFCVNPGGLPGLGATLNSLISYCSDVKQLRIHVLEAGLTKADRVRISAVCGGKEFPGELHFYTFHPEKEFEHFRPLMGDRATYGRLLLPTILSVDTVLYLDSDLLVCLDVLELRQVQLGQYLLGAQSGSKLGSRIDKDLLYEVGCATDMRYFNAGILLLNLREWRECGTDRLWKEFGEANGNRLVSNDQTILNYLCNGEFYDLGSKYNCGWLAHQSEIDSNGKIIHFIGSPKPWDLFGKYLHTGYSVWRSYQPELWDTTYGNSIRSTTDLRRLWNLRNSIGRTVKKRLSAKA